MTEPTFTTFITGVNVRGEDADIKVRTKGAPDRVHVALIGDMNVNGIDDPDSPNETLPVAWCEACGHPLDGDGRALDDSGDPELCLLNEPEPGRYGPHKPRPVPLAWANHASIDLDSEKDQIKVSISVADPRGAFVMEIRRALVGDPCPAGCRIQVRENPPGSDRWESVYELDGEPCKTCDGTGDVNRRYELRMSVPHPTDGFPHASLTDLNGRGFYKIGN